MEEQDITYMVLRVIVHAPISCDPHGPVEVDADRHKPRPDLDLVILFQITIK